MFVLSRLQHNPILQPIKEHPWEALAAFNWSPAKHLGLTHVLYRAMSLPEPLGKEKVSLSTIGHAISLDGIHFRKRRQLIVPEEKWERYGCEDPRVTKFEGRYYIFYTALSTFPFGPEGIKVAVAITKNFSKIEERHLVTPFNAKAMTLFPERVNGKVAAFFTIHTDRPPAHIVYVEFDEPEQIWSEAFWDDWYQSWQDNIIEDPRRGETDHVEIGAAPIKTKHGWLLIYSHIQRYFSDNKIFGIEALLLDADNPKKIIGRTHFPMLVPEELYEQHGHIPNIVFPSGALVRGQNLDIYYGAADTSCCKASVNLDHLLEAIRPHQPEEARTVQKFADNPIISPKDNHDWENKATFNPAAVDLGGKVHILYRAMGSDDTSVIGYASSQDGLHIDDRLDEPVYVPRAPFETKAAPGNSGCEDARIVAINDRLYMTYTAFNAVQEPRVAITSISQDDFLNKNWNWNEPILISPAGVMDKNTCVLPEKVGDQYLILHRIETDICADYVDNLEFTTDKLSKCVQVLRPRSGMWDSVKVGIAAPPLPTPKGWLLFYHGVADDGSYRVGAVLLDRKNPTIVLRRTTAPLLEPELEFEKEGLVPNVVFPCGAVLRDNTIFLYYGGADKQIGVAQVDLPKLLKILQA